MRWRAFSAHLVDLAEALGVQVVVTLGRAARRRPAHAPGGDDAATPPTRAARAPRYPGSSYEGPTGIVGVLHTACANAGLPSASLWAAVPHYVAAAPTRRRRWRCCASSKGLIGVSVDVSELEAAAADYERQVGLAVRSDPDIQAFVERLEQAADSEEQSPPEDLPSGDILASEFQRFLRQRGREGK